MYQDTSGNQKPWKMFSLHHILVIWKVMNFILPFVSYFWGPQHLQASDPLCYL